VTRNVVEQVMQQGTDLQLSAVQYSLRTDSPPLPVVLQGSLLEELSLRATRQEASLIQAMACGDRSSFRSPAQHWAINQIGMLQLGQARPCLERLTGEAEPRDIRILAIEALGNLGEAGALGTLLPLVPEPVAPQLPTVSPPASDEDAGVLQRAPADDDGDTRPDRLEDPEELPQNASDPEESRLPDQSLPETIAGVPVVPGRFDRDLTDAVLLAIGKIGSDVAIESLRNVALNSPDPALSSTAVHSLGLSGTPAAYDSLVAVSEAKGDALISDQASRTAQRIRPKR